MRHTAILVTAAALMWMTATGTAWSQGNAPPAGDIGAGKAVAAATCAKCHGLDGISKTPGTPHLSGQYANYIWTGLSVYKKGERRNRTMHGVVDQLGESDMVNVAAYYSSMKPFSQIPHKAAAPLPPEGDPFAEVREATAECAGCHGEDGNADIPGMPSLAGQHVTYLINALRAYQDGLRKNDEMQIFAEPLKASDIEDMAYYYAAMVPRQAEPPTEGDAFAGLAVTAPCAGCHADDGNNKDPKTPRLAGQDAEYLVAAVGSYKDGSRDHDVMREAVATLRESDIKDLAAYYASKEPRALPLRKPLTIKEWTLRCNRCHGPEGRSTDSRFPILAGQDEAYLMKTLKLYHGGERPSSAMQAMSFLMAESDIVKLAAYYARQPAK
ncbi:MAG: cytochrome c4 [Alphaproteobacteria bacterium]|nr:cytochrome c4 [Alphaproteobacteria bacterium]